MMLALAVLALAAVYFGTIQASFSALMRLSLRILAERSDRPGELGSYLDEPLQLFIPARALAELGARVQSQRDVDSQRPGLIVSHGLKRLRP